VPPTGPGERAVLLPWFWPDAASFHTLANAPTAIPWSAARADVGFLFFLLSRDIPVAVATTCRAGEADRTAAAAMLAGPPVPWLDWTGLPIQPVVRTAASAAHFAELLAVATNAVDPARAWAGAWLAYAGWLAVGAVEPSAVEDVLADPEFAFDPVGAQVRAWGMARSEVGWRLSAAWPMPAWARVVLGRLDATPAAAHEFGGDRRLLAVVQTAVVLAEQAAPRLFVADEFDLAASLSELGVTSRDLDSVRERFAAEVDLGSWLERDRADPQSDPTLARRLTVRVGPRLPDDEQTNLVDAYEERVQAAKLAAVAEFAAGASHEINNPLAVISGRSQYLLRQEPEPGRRQALQSIVRQTERIHAILTDLMYFARPPAPNPERLELGHLVRETTAAVTPLATERDIAVEVRGLMGPVWITGDRKQLSIALAALVRNGVEAAPDGGWVHVTSTFRPDRFDVVVEDSGPGPDEQSRAHLFDPFYSGRAAGRGRGLGLPAAWRLAKEHGGEVRYVPLVGGPTRFVLTLPASVAATAAQRKTA
jgi:two-component system, NtrC family, sensor kinase